MTNKILEKGCLIDYVSPGSPADKAGINAGWRLVRIDGQPVGDLIDFKILEADDQLSLLLMIADGRLKRIKIDKSPGTALGLRFNPLTIDRLKLCPNRCLFCFVDQNPKGLRSALYVKDDDYRLSFLYGNFITLNRLTDSDIERIVKMQMSPLYVSIHSTNPVIRNRIMGSKLAAKGLDNLKTLVKAGIAIHGQLVLCPGLNTGENLRQSINDLSALGEKVLSVALVPVGLTGHREINNEIRGFTAGEAVELIKEFERKQQDFLRQRGSRFIFLSDEFYNLASLPYPPDEAYEGYPQLENGVGLARQFLNELEQVAEALPLKTDRSLKITIISGKAASPLIEELARVLSSIQGLEITTVYAENNFFGDTVTVSGLLTGSDLLRVMESREKGDLVFITNNMLRDQGDLFLDDYSLDNLQKELGVPVRAVSGPLELFNGLKELYSGENKVDPKENRFE